MKKIGWIGAVIAALAIIWCFPNPGQSATLIGGAAVGIGLGGPDKDQAAGTAFFGTELFKPTAGSKVFGVGRVNTTEEGEKATGFGAKAIVSIPLGVSDDPNVFLLADAGFLMDMLQNTDGTLDNAGTFGIGLNAFIDKEKAYGLFFYVEGINRGPGIQESPAGSMAVGAEPESDRSHWSTMFTFGLVHVRR